MFRPVLTGVAVIQACRRVDAPQFGWREPPYEYEREKMPIDILAGSNSLRRDLDQDRHAVDIAREWEEGLAAFGEVRRDFLRY